MWPKILNKSLDGVAGSIRRKAGYSIESACDNYMRENRNSFRELPDAEVKKKDIGTIKIIFLSFKKVMHTKREKMFIGWQKPAEHLPTMLGN